MEATVGKLPVIGILMIKIYHLKKWKQDVICRGWFLPPNTIT